MSNDRLAEIKARIEAKLAEWPDFFHNVRSPLSAAETLWIIEQVEALTAERDALAEGHFMADITLCDDERLIVPCVLLDSNPDHADTCGSVLTPGADYPCSCWQADLRAALAATGEGYDVHSCDGCCYTGGSVRYE